MELFNPFSLSGKHVLVTGASSGIGRAIAVACAGMGATVYLTGRNEERLHDTFMLLPAGDHKEFIADLTVQTQIEKLVSVMPQLHGVVHCAGVGSSMLCKSINKKELDDVLRINLEAPVLLQASLLAQKKIRKEASVVFVASRASYAPSAGNAVYSASKGAVQAYAKCLALELAPRLIRVNSICPAMVWTDLIIQEGVSKEELEVAQLKYPFKRYGNPEDVAYLAVYLLSDAASWMTGNEVDLGGTFLTL